MAILPEGQSVDRKYSAPSPQKEPPDLELVGYINIIAGLILTIGIVVFLVRVPFSFTVSWTSLLIMIAALSITVSGLFLITRKKNANRRWDKLTGFGLVLLIALSIAIIVINIRLLWVAFF